jgi:hypothetical protein
MVSMLGRWLVYIVYEDAGERQDGSASKVTFTRTHKCAYVGVPLAWLNAEHAARFQDWPCYD